MNKRLELISSLIPSGKGFVDVGTDHGYLPVYMAQKGYCGNIIASDIKEGPLSTAVASAREADLEGRISFRLCDGLDGCNKDEVDTIVIAGMGGDTICGILDRAEWCMDSKYFLILQPMTKCEILRYWLANNEFCILDELLIKDNGEIYQIITARFGYPCQLSDAELFSGMFKLARKNERFPEYLESLIKRFQKAVTGMDKAKKAVGRRNLNAQILNQLVQMQEEMKDAQNT